MYSMPNDMYQGKLSNPDMEERFPHHVYLKGDGIAEIGGISLAIYYPDETIIEWLAHNLTGKYDYRKNVGDRPSPFQNPPMEPVYCFDNPDDALAFKLRWVNGR